jgi:hypothetical protein
MMTNKEYLEKSLAGLNISDDDIDIIFLKSGISGDDQVDVEACDKAVHKRFSVVLQNAARNLSAGGASISWNMEALKLYYASLCNEWGLENVLLNPSSKAKIRDGSNRW